MRRGRYVRNKFAAGDQPVPDLDADSVWRQVCRMLPELDECMQAAAVPQSTGSWRRDYSVYTGLGGVAMAFLRLGMHCRVARKDDASARAFLGKAREVAETCLKGDPRSREVSFFCGTPGYLAIAIVASHLLGESASGGLTQLLQWLRPALEHSEDELLFGRAGYLFALLWVRSHVGPVAADFDTPLQQTAERLVEAGLNVAADPSYAGWPLMWHCFDEPYIGAAHGHVGILVMLLQCQHLLKPRSRELVQGALEKLMSIRFPSGNLPICLGDRSDEHIHWCHGAPGIPTLAVAAAKNLPGAPMEVWKQVAEKAGDVVWERGVILKGNGLCHGIAGNGYTFLTLYRMTGDQKHLDRAQAFAHYLADQELQQAISRQPDSQRRVVGKPDSPRSLMEGSAGVVCFLLDVIAPGSSAFPAWELEVAS